MMSRPTICVSTDSVLKEGNPIRAITCPKSYPEAVAAAGDCPFCAARCARRRWRSTATP